MKPMNFPGRKDLRRESARERDAHRETLSFEARLLLCDSRPGECKRERERIKRQIEERDAPPSKVRAEDKKKKSPARTDKKALKALKKKQAK